MSTKESETKQEVITTRIWKEIPEDDNPFAAKACYLAGFDVYGDLLGRASWVEYLYLLFKLEPPDSEQTKLLEGLAVALANPGPRDHSVRAAMNAGVGGSTAASTLMAALAVGAGNLGGGREVFLSCKLWDLCGFDLDLWSENIGIFGGEMEDTWLPMEHAPGFDPNGIGCSTPVRQVLDYLVSCGSFSHLQWLQESREELEGIGGAPLAMSGVASAALMDLELKPDQAEMLFLLLRLPGAAVHALEQKKGGWGQYPFFGGQVHVTNDPHSEDVKSGVR